MTASPRTFEGIDLLRWRQVRLQLSGGQIGAIDDLGPPEHGPFLAPGLVDLQVGGAHGTSFNTPSVSADAVRTVSHSVLAAGTTTFLANVITNDPDVITGAVRAVAEAARGDIAESGAIGGIHLEGPFISPDDGPRGAHDKPFVIAPDWDLFQRWQSAANGLIKVVTVSPEWPQATEFIAKAASAGVLVAIGHTAATPQQIRDAIAAGARLSTHLGNGSHVELPRHDNYLWEQLASDALSAAFIADGAHLPDAVLKVMLRAKGERAFLVSDASSLTGATPGEYVTPEGRKVRLTVDNRLVLAANPRFLAGSVKLLPHCVAHLVNSGMATLPAAWAMASIRPGALLGLPASSGLTVGTPADVVSFEFVGGQVSVHSVIKGGHVVKHEEVPV